MKKSRIFAGLAILTALAVAGCSVPGGGGGGGGAGAGGTGPKVVNLRTAGNYVILSAAGVTTTGVPASAITGDIGASPVTSTSVTGFGLIGTVLTDTYLTSALVVGKVYTADLQPPTPATLTTAIADLGTAYNDAAGRPKAVGANLNKGAGIATGVTFAPGLYTWTTGLDITGDITIKGGANDTWIFQVAGPLKLEVGKKIILSGGALPKNIVWQVAGTGVDLLAGTHFAGVILAKKYISFTALATMNGRALAQTAVTMISTTLTKP